MNLKTYSGSLSRAIYQLSLTTRRLTAPPVSRSFGKERDQAIIQRIFVINLDRQRQRWMDVQRELGLIRLRTGSPLLDITERVPAVDAQSSSKFLGCDILTAYSLEDQLYVEPNLLLDPSKIDTALPIEMTRQEIAVAMSHIGVWKRIAQGSEAYVLVLEDDIYFGIGFVRHLDLVWKELIDHFRPESAFDVLYLSYKETKAKAEKVFISDSIFRPFRGLWYLSGYVLSKIGAQKLVDLLPVRGPIDLWMNLQFHHLNVFAPKRSIIHQRSDLGSTNAYSVLPILARVGLVNFEKPMRFDSQPTRSPVFAFGERGTGLTSLAMALSMVGYRCYSDMEELAPDEYERLLTRSNALFDAYINVGSLAKLDFELLASVYPNAKFIITLLNENVKLDFGAAGSRTKFDHRRSLSAIEAEIRRANGDLLLLDPRAQSDQWGALCEFLEIAHPRSPYPAILDLGQRKCCDWNRDRQSRNAKLMKFDRLPWIIPTKRNWKGIRIEGEANELSGRFEHVSEDFSELNADRWIVQNDTFPGNLALFRPDNLSIQPADGAALNLRKEYVGIRQYTSAAICSRARYLYGEFSVVAKPSSTPGTITGIFLHRNSPRQEIDLEFLGRDVTRLLANVYYNPGDEGSRIEYGYRGTPAMIDLGFDASESFHRYTVKWFHSSIQWLVDDSLIHERTVWDPTPIPHLPMRFYVNLWPTRAKKLAGRLDDRYLPATTEVRSMEMRAKRASDDSLHTFSFI